MINRIHSVDYLVDMPNVKLNIQDDSKIAWLANFTLDSYKEIRWHLSHPLSEDKVTVIK